MLLFTPAAQRMKTFRGQLHEIQFKYDYILSCNDVVHTFRVTEVELKFV